MSNLLLASAASGIIRNAHFVTPNGRSVPERTLLIEPPATNILVYSRDYSQAAWNKTNVTLTAAAAIAPDGTLTATKVAATASAATNFFQTTAAAAAAPPAVYTIYAKMGSGATDANRFILWNASAGTAVVQLTINYETGVLTVTTGAARAHNVGNGWWRIELLGLSGFSNTDDLRVYPAFTGNTETAGEFCYLWQADLVRLPVMTSPILTTTTTASRAADAISLTESRLNPARAMTLYLRGVELGTAAIANGRYAQLGDSANAAPRIVVYRASATELGVLAENGLGGSAQSVVTGHPSLYDLVELMAEFGPTGVTTLTRCFNEGTPAAGAPSGAMVMPAAWSDTKVWLGMIGTGTGGVSGVFGFTHFKMLEGVGHGLAAVRRAAGVR